ncbi:MAG: hypothetical protein KDE09_12745, partial [Anaerolineales bacterium]|nr:hypothetical protein [Anaerolineales bacterium]
LLYKFVTSSTVPGAPDTSCSSADCWELWSDFGTISRSGSAGSYTLTAEDVPLAELLGTPFVAGLRSTPTAISLSTFAPEVPAGSALIALTAIAALLLLLTVVVLYTQRRILP